MDSVPYFFVTVCSYEKQYEYVNVFHTSLLFSLHTVLVPVNASATRPPPLSLSVAGCLWGTLYGWCVWLLLLLLLVSSVVVNAACSFIGWRVVFLKLVICIYPGGTYILRSAIKALELCNCNYENYLWPTPFSTWL